MFIQNGISCEMLHQGEESFKKVSLTILIRRIRRQIVNNPFSSTKHNFTAHTYLRRDEQKLTCFLPLKLKKNMAQT